MEINIISKTDLEDISQKEVSIDSVKDVCNVKHAYEIMKGVNYANVKSNNFKISCEELFDNTDITYFTYSPLEITLMIKERITFEKIMPKIFQEYINSKKTFKLEAFIGTPNSYNYKINFENCKLLGARLNSGFVTDEKYGDDILWILTLSYENAIYVQ